MRKFFLLRLGCKYGFSLALPFVSAMMSHAATISSQLSVEMTTDKACYTPGQVVVFSASGSLPSNAYVRYRHGAMVLWRISTTMMVASTSIRKEEDYKFKVKEAGYYDITIDLDQMRIYVKKGKKVVFK